MSNPFEEPENDTAEILEGFLCPICREDLKSPEFLIQHFERSHADEQDALKSVFKDIFWKAKKKILNNFDDAASLPQKLEKVASLNDGMMMNDNSMGSSNARTATNVYNFMQAQQVGAQQEHMKYFESVRNPRLEHYASETNKLIIRLHKLLRDMPTDAVQRKQHEQNIVPWLDGSTVKLCPNCAKSFHIARRQHHCRLCGSIMCHDCSKFLSIEVALQLASLSTSHSDVLRQQQQQQAAAANAQQQTGIRCCDHCLWLLETRQEMLESRACHPAITQFYEEIQQLRKDVTPDIEMYLKIIASLYEGESIFKLADASALRGKIGKIAEAIDLRSKRILALHAEPGSRAEALKKSIRLCCIQLIKDKMLSLPPLPSEEEIRKIQLQKRMETEQRIETERRRAIEIYERAGLNLPTQRVQREADFVYVSDLPSLDNWAAPQLTSTTGHRVQTDDPLVEQINIIKGYIKQARQEMNFEVVETLELNLRELQREFYLRQRATSHKEESATAAEDSVVSTEKEASNT